MAFECALAVLSAKFAQKMAAENGGASVLQEPPPEVFPPLHVKSAACINVKSMSKSNELSYAIICEYATVCAIKHIL